MSRERRTQRTPSTPWTPLRAGAIAGLVAVALGFVGLGGGGGAPAASPPAVGSEASGRTPETSADSGAAAAAAARRDPSGARFPVEDRTEVAGRGLSVEPAVEQGAGVDPEADTVGPKTVRIGGDRACGQRAEGSITADEAKQRTDQAAAVEFRVARTFDSGKVTFLNSRDPYQGHFYVAIFPDDYAAFPEPPAEYFDGKCVVVQGRIELYRGTPQIVLRLPEDILVVGD